MLNKSAYFILSILLCLCNSVFSNNSTSPPPTNDICTGAMDLGVLECGFYALYDEDPEATPDPEATGNCIDNTDIGQWYTFTTPDPIPYNSIYTASTWIDFEIFSTTTDCSALVYEGCGTGPFAFEPEAGTKYYYLTTGGFHMTLPFAGLSTCDDPLVSFSSCDSPILSGSYTDCAAPNSMVVCPNDHVMWFEYVAGNSGADVIISIDEFSGAHGNTADEIGISVFSDDCSSLLFGYDQAGWGYVCSAMAGGQSITLVDLPPGYHVKIAISSGLNDVGHFDLLIETAIEDGVANDLCMDAEELLEGISSNLSNVCSDSDIDIDDCPPQSEATVWYEFDPGSIPQDIEITLHPTGIVSPAIAVYDNCWGSLLEAVCGTSLELFCIDYPILIQIGSTYDDEGTFNLEIESNPSTSAVVPVITASPICSNSEAGILITIPSGEIVNIIVEISYMSSGLIAGMNTQSFLGVNSALIMDTLINTGIGPEEAIYTITIESFGDICLTEPVEFSILVHPEFKITEIAVEECAPYLLELDAFDIIEGGTVPYLGILWYWNTSELIGTTNLLSSEIVESGEITLKIVDSEGCRQEIIIDVDMSIRIDPTFDFDSSYCRTGQDSIIFPKTSLEGIEGSWSPASIDLEQNSEDDFYDILFTPDDEYCSNLVIDSILIYSGDVPEFDLPVVFCEIDSLYIFPSVDQNGIIGSWDVPSLDLSNFEGVFTNTFTHSNQDCSASFDYEFVVEPKIELAFGQPATLCRHDEPYVLSNMSQDGYEGNWDVPIIDPNLVPGSSITSTWTPMAGQSPCLYEASVTIEITEPLIPEFILPIELCSLDGSYTFPTEDIQSLGGTWSIPNFIPGDITGSIESVFTSNDDCAETYTWEIEIVEPLIPEFDLDLEHCALDDIYTLPLISNNGIPGSWTQSSIDPSITAGQQIMIEFQSDPTEFCVESIEVVIEVTEAQDPIFDLPTLLCWTDENLLLPSASTNAIEGIWTPSLIDVASNPGTMLSSTFTPTDGSCSNEETETFEILSPYEVDPIATDPSDCSIEDGSIMMDIIQGNNLEFSIDGGMTWQSSTLFSSLGSGGFTILIQSTEIPDCGLSVESFLSSPDGPVINEVMSSDINSCTVENGSIIIDATGNNLEYSIDDGLTWQSSNEFDNLSEGDYVINIREMMSDCVVDVGAAIMDFPQTEILDVNTEDLTDCNLDDGQIEILAVGEALEYSIDNGASWSSQNIFNNLPSGEFNILVQSTLGVDCLASDVVNITAPSMPIIINSDTENPTQCVPTTGRIEVEAEGNNLEYSIDGGLTWQSSNIFSDLVSEEYQLIVRDSERINCFVDGVVSIILEDETLPESSIMITPPSECDFSDARLEVANATADVEYSIDGGMSWQTDNIFDNLTAGTYELITRKIALPECLVIQEIVIPNSACPCNTLQLDFRVENITCTGDDFALVELTSIQGMNDADIDILWQNGETNLSIEVAEDGWQIVTIAYDDDCVWMDTVWVELVKPIEFELNVEDLDCPEVNNGILEVLNVVGGSGAYEYSIDGVEYQSESIFTDLGSDVYQVYVRDETNCLTIEEAEVLANDKIEISLTEIETIFIGESVVLDPNIDAARIDDFNWSPQEGILNANDLVITVSPNGPTIYTLEIFYGECSESAEVTVLVKPKEEVHIGNVFSPNGDNASDVVYLQGVPNSTIELVDFSIFDRWGNMIFYVSKPEFNNKEDGWDGRFNGALASSGVYVYFVSYIQYGEEEVKVGTITLLQ